MRNITMMNGFWKKAVGFTLMFIFMIDVLYGQTFTSQKAVTVSNGTPTTPNGSATGITVGQFSFFTFPSGPTNYYTYRSLVEFDLSSMAPDAVIISATLKFFQSASTGTTPLILARNSNSWDENTATWSNKPNYQTYDEITTFSSGSGVVSFNVKDHVQKMVNGAYPNYGWVLRSNATVEGGFAVNNRTFYSDDYTVVASRPTLEITYYRLMSVASATIVHATTSSPSETTGSVSPVLVNGPGGTYSYQWYNSSGTAMSGKTALNLTGVPSGWYGLKVTSSVAGTDPFFYAFIIGAKCERIPIEFNPGPDYIDDAVLNTNSLLGNSDESTNFPNEANISFQTTGFASKRSALKFRLWFDPQMEIDNAVMSLNANAVNYSAPNPNNGAMYVATEYWGEKSITYTSQPDYSVSNPVLIPVLSSAPQLRQFDISNSCELWQQNNTQNFGWLIKLTNESVFTTIGQHYNSSDAATNKPKINFNISVSNPTAPNYCNQVFAKMDRTLRGVLYKPYLTHLYFYYDEEYDTPNTGLNYRVYQVNNPIVSVLNSTIQPLNQIKYGDNRYTLDVSNLNPEVYILEITNNKSEKFYLRFKVEN